EPPQPRRPRDGAAAAAGLRAAADDGHHHDRGARRRRRRRVQVAGGQGPAAAPRLDRRPALGRPQDRVDWERGAGLGRGGPAGLEAKVTPYAPKVTAWLLTQAGVVGALTLQFLLTVVIAGVLYAQGEAAAAQAQLFGFKLAGQRGEDAVVLAGKAIRGVALGV